MVQDRYQTASMNGVARLPAWVHWWISTGRGSLWVSSSSDLKVICNSFSQNCQKVVLTCLLQYKPVCVINFNKLRCKMPKRRSLVIFFSIAILRKSSSCVTSYQDALVSFALLLRFDKKCSTRLCFKNPFLRLSVCLYVFARSVVNI